MLDLSSDDKCLRFCTLNLVSVPNVASCAGFTVLIWQKNKKQKTEALACTHPSAGAAP